MGVACLVVAVLSYDARPSADETADAVIYFFESSAAVEARGGQDVEHDHVPWLGAGVAFLAAAVAVGLTAWRSGRDRHGLRSPAALRHEE